MDAINKAIIRATTAIVITNTFAYKIWMRQRECDIAKFYVPSEIYQIFVQIFIQ